MEKNTCEDNKFICVDGKNYPVKLWIKNIERNNTSTISYPTEEESEFEVQSKLYCRLIEQGFIVKGEVRTSNNERKDLVVFDKNNKPKCIIETKNFELNSDIEKELNKKRRKAKLEEHLKYNLPLIYCTNSKLTEKTIDNIKNLLECKE